MPLVEGVKKNKEHWLSMAEQRLKNDHEKEGEQSVW